MMHASPIMSAWLLLLLPLPHNFCVASPAPTIGAPAFTPASTHFVSNDQVYCAEGTPREAEAALAMLKAAPIGGLFNLSSGASGSCASRGYTVSGGADACTPGATTYFKAAADRRRYQDSVQAAIDGYARRYQLPPSLATLMTQCVCAPNSTMLHAASGRCASGLKSAVGAWVHQDPYTGHLMMCDEGPFVFATRALSVLKASPQLAMHYRDQISPLSCPELGFPMLYPPVDHCYTSSDQAMHIYTRTAPIGNDAGVKESIATEVNLTGNYSCSGSCTSNGFYTFAQAHWSLDDFTILNNNLGCNCLGPSPVGKSMVAQCWGPNANTPHSPVRDWWTGEN